MNQNELLRSDGAFADLTLTRLDAVRAKLNLTIEDVAKAAKISKGHLGNTTRFRGNDRLRVSTAFATRLAAALDAFERAQSADEVHAVINLGTTAAPAAAIAAPSTHRAEEGGGQSTDDFVAIMRRRGIISISITLEPSAKAA